MAFSGAEVLKEFKCQAQGGVCIMGLHKGLTDEYEVKGTKLVFRGEVLGDLTEQSVADIICYEHCHERYFDEVLGAPREKRASLNVVKRYSKRRRLDGEEDDF